MILIFPVLFCCLLTANNGQELLSFREKGDLLQIFYGTIRARGEWYNVSANRFNFMEGIIVCANLSNGSFVDFQTSQYDEYGDSFDSSSESEDSDEETRPLVAMHCENFPQEITDCYFVGFSFRNEIISNLNCIDASGHREGDIRQLEDGSIVQLRALYPGRFIWAHFCSNLNPGWNINVTNLACEKLGYKKGSDNLMNIEDKHVYGLEGVDCRDASDFLECTSEEARRNRYGMCPKGVLGIICEGRDVTTTITLATTTMTTTTMTTTATIIPTSQPPISPTHTLYNETTNLEFIEQYRVHIISGISVVVILFIGFVIGCLVLFAIVICLAKSGYWLRAEEREMEKEPDSDKERKECEPYARMRSHPNGNIKLVLKKDKLYDNVDEMENSTQHTYLQMAPVRVELNEQTKDSIVEQYYTLY